MTAMLVGNRYRVPCVFVEQQVRSWWMPRDGWVPTIGPRHEDREYIQFDYEHWHVDWRFMPSAQYDSLCDGGRPPHPSVVMRTGGNRYDRKPVCSHETSLRSRLCKRVMPDFPGIDYLSKRLESLGRWKSLERAQQERCPRLKPGNICPHRGVDLTPFARADGTAICPGHGLHWNLRTGELIPRFTATEAA